MSSLYQVSAAHFKNIPFENQNGNPADGNISDHQRTIAMKRKSKGKQNFGIISLLKLQTRLGMQFFYETEFAPFLKDLGEHLDITKKRGGTANIIEQTRNSMLVH